MQLSEMQQQALANCIREQEKEHPDTWDGFEWYDVNSSPATLNSLVSRGILNISYKSRAHTSYILTDIEAAKDLLDGAANEGYIAPDEEETPLEIPHDLFEIVVGHDQTKNILKMSLMASDPVHCLLVGLPATAKSLLLSELARLPGSRLALGGTSSRAGIVDFLIDVRPRFLIIDELEKADRRDMDVLLSLMEGGLVTRLKKGMREQIRLKTWVYAGANSDKYISPAMMSRFIVRHMPAYSQQDFNDISFAMLTKRERIDPTWATAIIDKLKGKTLDPRDSVKVGRMLREFSQLDSIIDAIY